ncbi:MAG: RNA polymerase sigma factor [Planctomycetia bacterium]|nr:RNA polymerase sigma factor [Planctomycetia bacterium]
MPENGRYNGMRGNPAQFEKRWREWFEAYHRIIHGYLFTLTQNRHLADDLTQETFVRAWEKRALYEERGTGKAFLFRIAVHCLRDFYRKRHEVLCDEEDWAVLEREDACPTPDWEAERTEDILRLRAAMSRLKPAQRQILTLRFFSQLRFSEIAEVLEMPINTVLSHARRGIEALKEIMGASCETERVSGNGLKNSLETYLRSGPGNDSRSYE